MSVNKLSSYFRNTIIYLWLMISVGLYNHASAQNGKALVNIIPKPANITVSHQQFKINRSTVIVAPAGTDSVAAFLQSYIRDANGFTLPVRASNALKNYITFKIDTGLVNRPEGYWLNVSAKCVEVIAHDKAGIFYALQTLIQLKTNGDKNLTWQGCVIKDYPRFAYRGMHLDVSRHMFRVSSIKKWINLLAFYKINRFQWHLTDDQGWRIEIKKYPLLQSIAAYRNQTLIGHKRETPHRFDGIAYGGYYTQQEVKDVVEYAKKRHITVIPEIEMPGHALAALAAYPELGCTGGPYRTATFWGVFDDVFCAGNEATFTFLQNVLDEVIELFPSAYIHIGGDECPKVRWKTCPKCQERIRQQNLKNEEELQSYFIKRIEKYLVQKNRKIIGWDEILLGGISKDATIMSWTGTEGGIAAAQTKHNAIMTPEKFVYLDYYQSLYPNEPIAAGGYTPLSKVYKYEPVPASLNNIEAKYITGVQANVWSEYITSTQKAEYMMFPRIIALAEIGWTISAQRNYHNFLLRLRSHYSLLKKLKVNAANNFDEITDTLLLPGKSYPVLKLNTTCINGLIKFTVNGAKPTLQSKTYGNGIVINKTTTVKASVFIDNKQAGQVFTKHVLFHKAVNKQLDINVKPIARFDPGNVNVLVNGIQANRTYNDGQWLGFTDTSVVINVNLSEEKQIDLLGMNILKYHWQKMWEPDQITFFISADGRKFQKVYTQAKFPVNGINRIRAKLNHIKAKYIKVVASNKNTIPPGQYGAGTPPIFLTDEIIVN